MLVREGGERNDSIDLSLAAWLAGVAGALNAAAFHAVGFFSANMTGNVSSVSDRLALGQYWLAAFYFGIVVAFVGGAACSAALIEAGRRRTRRIYAYAILIEAGLLAILGWADLLAVPEWRVPEVVLGLAFAMGFQNAVATRISDGRVRTTHVSGLATDIGIELAAGFEAIRRRREGGAGPRFGKLRLQVGTVLAFLVGGAAGVVLYGAIGGYLMMVAGGVLLLVAASAILRARAPWGAPAAVAAKE